MMLIQCWECSSHFNTFCCSDPSDCGCVITFSWGGRIHKIKKKKICMKGNFSNCEKDLNMSVM